jgi:3',5'-cyclic-AMP phosphodiesterase
VKSTIAYITDIHLDEQFPIEQGADPNKNWRIILNDIKSRGISEIIFGGDIGSSSAHPFFFNSLKEICRNLKITLGNHDKFDEIKNYYSFEPGNGRKELYYSYEDEYYKYIFLDSSSDKVSRDQLKWLKDEFPSDSKKAIIFIHHPILEINTPIDRRFPLKNRENLKEIILKHNSEVCIFCGHYHLEDELLVSNIRQYVTPAASYQAVKEAASIKLSSDTFGYRIINFNSEPIETEVVLFDKTHF